jgi:hypothetical protein
MVPGDLRPQRGTAPGIFHSGHSQPRQSSRCYTRRSLESGTACGRQALTVGFGVVGLGVEVQGLVLRVEGLELRCRASGKACSAGKRRCEGLLHTQGRLLGCHTAHLAVTLPITRITTCLATPLSDQAPVEGHHPQHANRTHVHSYIQTCIHTYIHIYILYISI